MAIATCLADLPPGGDQLPHLPGYPVRPSDHRLWPQLLFLLHHPVLSRSAGCAPLSCLPLPLHDRDFKRNMQLSHIMAIAMQLPTRRSRRKWQETRPLCEKHNQTLTLFCEQDLELLCAQCRGSSDHQDHNLMALKRAAASHRKKLKSSVVCLKEAGGAEEGLQTQVSNSLQLKMEVEKQRIDLYSEFEQLMRLLGKEQDAIFWRLMMEEKDLQEKVIENSMQISEHISTLRNLLSEIREKYVESKLELLTDIDNIYKSYENFKTPAVFLCELRK
ncbi:tripartite motif-containing protein 60-like isoform X1 [Tamandua tetradactyla]|uniref:tripartite motif-containing protein 60-like isoform X1 n=1 Tax=Tamandua tetradactyla TaxID=48850 RepID=UPI0040543AA1